MRKTNKFVLIFINMFYLISNVLNSYNHIIGQTWTFYGILGRIYHKLKR